MASKKDCFLQVDNKNCIEDHIYEIFCSKVIWLAPEEILTLPIQFDFYFNPDQYYIGIILPDEDNANVLDLKPLYVHPTKEDVQISIKNISELGLRIPIGEKLGELIIQHKVKDYRDC